MTVRRFRATIPPLVLQGLTATATNSTTINVSWNAYPGATAYQVRRNGTLIATPTGTTYTNSGHTASTSYTYAVRPVVGGVGVASAEASVVVVTPASSEYAGLVPTVTVSTAAALQSALASATAGAIIGVEPGIYTGTNTVSRYLPAFRTTNSGAAGNPIRIVARYPASSLTTPASNALRSELRSGGSVAGSGCPAFGNSSRSYVEWIGLCVVEDNSPTTPDTGPIVLWDTTGGAIRRCVSIGSSTYLAPDNHPGIRLEGAHSCTVEDNVVQNWRCTTVNGNNGAGIQLYNSTGNTLQHNTISGCGSGIFCKGPGVGEMIASGGATIRFNRIESCLLSGVILSEVTQGASTAFNVVERNLIVSCGEQGIYLWQLANATSPNRFNIRRNTVVDCASGMQVQTGNSALFGPSDVTDNLFQGGVRVMNSVNQTAANFATLRTSVGLSFNRNAGHGASSGNWILAYSTNMALATWVAQSGLDAASSYLGGDVSTIFVNKAGGNYRPGSAVSTISSTGGPVGCYDVSGGTEPGVRA